MKENCLHTQYSFAAQFMPHFKESAKYYRTFWIVQFHMKQLISENVQKYFFKADHNSLGGYCEAIYNSRLLSGSVIRILSSSILLLAAKFFLKCLKQDFRDKISKLTRASLINIIFDFFCSFVQARFNPAHF